MGERCHRARTFARQSSGRISARWSFSKLCLNTRTSKYRLVGTRVSEVFLADATGLTIREAYARAGANQSFADSVVRTHRIVCEKQSPIRISGGFGEWRDRVYPAYDGLYLPLSDDGVRANMVLNACTFTSRSVQAAA